MIVSAVTMASSDCWCLISNHKQKSHLFFALLETSTGLAISSRQSPSKWRPACDVAHLPACTQLGGTCLPEYLAEPVETRALPAYLDLLRRAPPGS
ncbi:hypothetical protein ElyMa_000727900 [Elysia marginata]|uniref:Uncharacterized protein n=1 Tax=Elysia marginata TaxID=1093978 RepID=A0AAV4GNN1_9GAST|nr:hypothetical protein ElyMa_000727900 [Elysia marginata]